MNYRLIHGAFLIRSTQLIAALLDYLGYQPHLWEAGSVLISVQRRDLRQVDAIISSSDGKPY